MLSGEGKQLIDFLPQPPDCRCPQASPKQCGRGRRRGGVSSAGRRAQPPASRRVLAAPSLAPPRAREDLARAPRRVQAASGVWRPGPNFQRGAVEGKECFWKTPVSATPAARVLATLARAGPERAGNSGAHPARPSPFRAGDRAEVNAEVSRARAGRALGAVGGERSGHEPRAGRRRKSAEMPARALRSALPCRWPSAAAYLRGELSPCVRVEGIGIGCVSGEVDASPLEPGIVEPLTNSTKKCEV